MMAAPSTAYTIVQPRKPFRPPQPGGHAEHALVLQGVVGALLHVLDH